MAQPSDIDGVLIEWGDRLFYPGNRRVRPAEGLSTASRRKHAAAIRARIVATFVRRAPQVIVKVSGGGRGMKAIAAHFRYISKNGRLSMEDEREQLLSGKDAVREIADDWRYGGALIEDESFRREAFNIVLSMPAGTNAEMVRKASREFAQHEFSDHKYVIVLHEHQANPHVHLSVRAESIHGRRLNPRKEDLRRWRENFAEKLRGWGIDAEASGQACRGVRRRYPDIWRLKAKNEGRLRHTMPASRNGEALATSTPAENAAWKKVADVLANSPIKEDQKLAREVVCYFQQKFDEASPSRGFTKTVDRAR
jgi:hypothetical protein